ncbi:hypothetical protein CRG98_037936 [Punica granatum]|uniref:Uncharacterized protein n=1 Tax=Punica granatum TaxID=22663 RepID=A0A2I0ICY2_PUNGR|nr:hypothetical protein CRG98_037936 [Punica granatum]
MVNHLATNMATNRTELMAMLRNQNQASSSFTPPPEHKPIVDPNPTVPLTFVSEVEDASSFSVMVYTPTVHPISDPLPPPPAPTAVPLPPAALLSADSTMHTLPPLIVSMHPPIYTVPPPTVPPDYEKFVIQTFQDSLTRSALDWFMTLKAGNVPTWTDLSQKFLDQYRFCAETPLTLLNLNMTEMREGQALEVDPRLRDLLSRLNVLQPPELNRAMLLHRISASSTPLYQFVPPTYSSSFSLAIRSKQKRLVLTLTPPCRIKTCTVNSIKEMIDTRQISFNEVKPLNVRTNPFPDHGSGSGPSINMISIAAIEEDENMRKIPIPFVINHASTEVAIAVVSFVIEVLAKELYHDSRVPWTYEGEVANAELEMSAMAFSEVVPLLTKKVTDQEAEAFMKIMGGTSDSPITESADFSLDAVEAFFALPTIYAVTEETSSGVHIRPGTFYYKVMPFGLKNVGATYERAMVTLFHDMMHKEIEVYVDDMIAKSKEVSKKGIEVDPDKVKAIMELPPPSTMRKVRSFLGRLNYIARFIANLTNKCQPLFRLLCKNAAVKWDDECQKAFDIVNAYLVQPPVLVPPSLDRPLILYLTADLLKYLLDSPSSMRNVAKWRCQLTEYDIEILQVSNEEETLGWKMYFDGAVNSTGSGIGAVLISPEGRHFSVAAKIDFPCTNNKAKYEACILDLQAVIDLKVKELQVFGDSMLTIFQTLKQWKTKDPKLNQFADALATLTSMVSITKENLIELLEFEIAQGPSHCDVIDAVDGKPWYADIKHLLQTGQFPALTDCHDRRTLRRIAAHFFLSGETLYRHSLDATLLRCVDENEVQRLMEEVHEGNCGPHMNGLMLAKKLMRLGYFWSTMETDCVKHVRHCHLCQVYANQIRALPNELHPMVAPWPFSMWSMDMIGPVNPKASNGHLFILTSIRSSTGATPYSLVYGMEEVLPIEVEIPSMRVPAESKLKEAEWAKQRYEQLNLIDEKRLTTICHDQYYQQRMARTFNKKVRPREFSPREPHLVKSFTHRPRFQGQVCLQVRRSLHR